MFLLKHRISKGVFMKKINLAIIATSILAMVVLCVSFHLGYIENLNKSIFILSLSFSVLLLVCNSMKNWFKSIVYAIVLLIALCGFGKLTVVTGYVGVYAYANSNNLMQINKVTSEKDTFKMMSYGGYDYYIDNTYSYMYKVKENGIKCPLAMETSGHAAFAENYYLDDGAYLVTKIIIKAAILRKENKKIGDCIAGLKKPLEEKELRFNITEENFRQIGEELIEEIKKIAEADCEMILAPDNYEGVRVSFNDKKRNGWFLLRLSVHDPVMPFNTEINTKGGCVEICRTFYEIVKNVKGIDFTTIKDFIKMS